MLRTTIEVALFHLIRDEEMAKQWTCSICADVRSIPVKSLDAMAQEEVREKFGLYAGVFSRSARELEAKREVLLASRRAGREDLADSLEKWCREDLRSGGDSSLEGAAGDVASEVDRTLRRQRMLGFIGTDGVLPIVEDVLGQYEGTARLGHLRVREARGCHLPEGAEGAKRPENRALHYWSDWVAGASREHHKGSPLPRWLHAITDGSGCNEAYDQDLRRRLRQARWALRGEVIRAASDLIEAGAAEPSASLLRRRCGAVVASALSASSDGSVFVDACRRGSVLRREHTGQRPAPTFDALMRVLQECIPEIADRKIEVVRAALDREFCVVAVLSRDLDLSIQAVFDQERGVAMSRQLRTPPPKIVAWTDDALALAKQVLGRDVQVKLREDGSIVVTSKVSDVKVRAASELTGRAVVRAAI
jgi:hypothetical protein